MSEPPISPQDKLLKTELRRVYAARTERSRRMERGHPALDEGGDALVPGK